MIITIVILAAIAVPLWLFWSLGYLGGLVVTSDFAPATTLGPWRVQTERYEYGSVCERITWISLDGRTWNRETTGEKPSRYVRRLLRERFAWELERANITSLEKAYRELEKTPP